MTTIFKCDYCGAKFEEEMDCQKCERSHETLLSRTEGIHFFNEKGDSLPVTIDGYDEAMFIMVDDKVYALAFVELCESWDAEHEIDNGRDEPIPKVIYKYNDFRGWEEFSPSVEQKWILIQKMREVSEREAN